LILEEPWLKKIRHSGILQSPKGGGYANRIIDTDEKEQRSRNSEKGYAKTSLSNSFAETIKLEGEYQ
jgi:hypothetical protein